MTGFSAVVRGIVRERSDGWCEKCGRDRAAQFHHRRPRGMGGSKQDDTNTAANCLHVSEACHLLIEEDREVSRNHGWLVRQHHDPAEIPVFYRDSWVFLDALGNLQPIQEVIGG